jgi:glycosyltransferase involved in cell wall biosynthesis
MKLSIITVGRNDNFGGNFVQRLEHNINKLISNIDRLDIKDIEIILTDWGSDDRCKLIDIMDVPSRDYLKFIHVPIELTKKYSPDSNFSCPHAANTAIRRSSGQYILYIDGDTYFPFSAFEKFYLFLTNLEEDYSFYWCNRIHIPFKVQVQAKTMTDIDKFIFDWESNGKVLVDVHDYWKGKGWCKNTIDLENFGGGATAILLNREICLESSFWWEKLTKWGWMDIEYHNRLSTKYTCKGELSTILSEDIFHIGHHDSTDENGKSNGFGGEVHGMNSSIRTSSFHANEENWGLIEEELILVSK